MERIQKKVKGDLWGKAEGSTFRQFGKKSSLWKNNLPHIGSNWHGGQRSTNGCPQKSSGSRELLWEEFGIAPWWAHPALASSTAEKGMREHQGLRRRRCFMRSRYTPRGTCTLEKRKRARRKEQQRKTVTLWPQPPALLTAALRGLTATCSWDKV